MPRQRTHHRAGHRPKRFNNQNPKHSQSSPSSSSQPKLNETPKEIPGYYYDHEKNRYFKIMPNKTVGSSHPFSADSIETKTKLAKEVNSCLIRTKVLFLLINLFNYYLFFLLLKRKPGSIQYTENFQVQRLSFLIEK